MATANDVVEKAPVDHVETSADIDHTKDARIAAAIEHETTLWQALKSNRKAAMWSVLLSTTIIMEGYDVGEWLHKCLLFQKLTSRKD